MVNKKTDLKNGSIKTVATYYVSALCVAVVFIKIMVIDFYRVVTPSMYPTIEPGQRVQVDKMLFGPRIMINEKKYVCRIPGLRELLPGDVILFNTPIKKWSHTIELNNTEVYCKRVLGCPGDRIGAVDGHCWNDKVLRPIGVLEEQERLRWMFDSVFIWNDNYDVIPLTLHRWNIKNWGPLVVPAKGMKISLDGFTRELYRQVIEYETGDVMSDDLEEYSFKGDYYFALGDNSMNSNDSRYWGFIPEEFIIGIVGGR